MYNHFDLLYLSTDRAPAIHSTVPTQAQVSNATVKEAQQDYTHVHSTRLAKTYPNRESEPV